MKISHNLRSAEHISRRELEKLLKGSLGTAFEVDSFDLEQMINGIMTVCNVQPLCIRAGGWEGRSYTTHAM